MTPEQIQLITIEINSLAQHLQSSGDPEERADLIAAINELHQEIAVDAESESVNVGEEGFDEIPASIDQGQKLAVVVGHTRKAPGACGVAPIDSCEYHWNSYIAHRMCELASPMGVDCAVFYRDNGTEKAYKNADSWGADAIIELHYNAFKPSSTGTETLWGTKQSVPWAEAAQRHMVRLLGLSDRGLKDRSESGRGHYNLTLSKTPSIIVEPFFGSSYKDAVIGQQNKTALAKAYLNAFVEFSS